MGSATTDQRDDDNLDPISGAPGAHPVGTGLGAAIGGAAAGAATGAVAGPIGTAIGAAAGAIIGGLAGKGIAESLDPTAEDAYWRENYATRPYVRAGADYDDYRPAYQYGIHAYAKYEGLDFGEIEPDLERDWPSSRGSSTLSWVGARLASLDAWEHAGSSRSGYRD